MQHQVIRQAAAWRVGACRRVEVVEYMAGEPPVMDGDVCLGEAGLDTLLARAPNARTSH